MLTSGGDSAGMNAVVRAVVKYGIIRCAIPFLTPNHVSYHLRGCETYVVREGYEGLVRGNVGRKESSKKSPGGTLGTASLHSLNSQEHFDQNAVGIQRAVSPLQPLEEKNGEIPEELHDDDLVHNLRFGDGPLLREGQGDNADHPQGKTLKGRYIIRVGWDDVRGWFAEVINECNSLLFVVTFILGWNVDRHCTFGRVQNS